MPADAHRCGASDMSHLLGGEMGRQNKILHARGRGGCLSILGDKVVSGSCLLWTSVGRRLDRMGAERWG